MILAPTLSLSAGSGAAIARPTFSRDFAGEKTLNNGTGPAITFTRASNATFFDANGTLQTAANDTPRFDHSGGSSWGLLIEESRTNSLRNSQAGGATVGVIGSGGVLPTNWVAGAVTGVSREIVGTGTVNGLNYVDIRFYGTRSGGSINTINISAEPVTQIVASSGQTWTGSAHVAVVGGSLSNITDFSLTVAGRTNTGSGISGESAATVITISSQLSRYTATRTLVSASVERVHLWAIGQVADGATIDVTFRVAAPQLEQGAFATSYIPTTTAAATRAADSAVVTPIASFYNQTEGTLFAELTTQGSLLASRYLQFDDGTDENRITLGTTSNGGTQNFASVATSTTLSSGIVGVFVSGVVYKAGAAFATDNMISARNGTLGPADTSGAMPSGLNRFGINGQTGSAGNRGHWLRKIAYYPRRLSDQLLQQLTT
jgi:hypothetical protein